ncbi:glycosyl hydrolase family 18 protein [Methyloligella halotolerans]|uniref:glycosyl hydrolase family 18 protein n=1 Tax=Methyloligella halotolerans TaxID=1177755 RepID=UPI001470BF45
MPWLFNRQTGLWITYDDPDSLFRKARYARDAGLAGVMIWEMSGDDGSLLPAVLHGLSPEHGHTISSKASASSFRDHWGKW